MDRARREEGPGLRRIARENKKVVLLAQLLVFCKYFTSLESKYIYIPKDISTLFRKEK